MPERHDIGAHEATVCWLNVDVHRILTEEVGPGLVETVDATAPADLRGHCHKWLRRSALGFALVAVFLASCASRPEESTRVTVVASESTIRASDTSAGVLFDAAPAPGGEAGERWVGIPTVVGGENLPGVFWTGTEVLILRTLNRGGNIAGERWNPATNEIAPLAASELVWRANPAMAWTGEEVLIIGGVNGPGLDQIGAAYNPSTDSWRATADPPGGLDAWGGSMRGPGVWTGEEMLVWKDALAYSPATDSWRRIEPSPLSERWWSVTVWTGKQLVVWGGCQNEGVQCDESNTGLFNDGAIYDPSTDLWTELPPSPLVPAAHTVFDWTGSEVLIVVTDPADDDGSLAATLDPETLEWTAIDAPPTEYRRYAAGAWAGDQFVLWGGRADAAADLGFADGATYDPVAGTWTPIEDVPEAGRSLHRMIFTGDRLYISATSAVREPFQLRLPPVGS